MMVRLKNVDRKMKIILFIIQLITKLEYFSLGEPYKYHNFKDFTRMRGFSWKVSDCEELVGLIKAG